MAGALLFNGNAETEGDLIRGAAWLLRGSRHVDPAVAASRQVLLVTAGWGEGEHDEGHVKRAINEIGLPSRHEGGFDRTIVNLSLRQELRGAFREAPGLDAAFQELRSAVLAARSFYLAHNAHLIALLRRALADARAIDPGLRLSQLLGIERSSSAFGERSLLRLMLGRELRHAIATLEENDDRLGGLLRDLEERSIDASGMLYDPVWRAARARLEARILGANSIVLFGGQLDLVLGAMRFFRLRDPLAEALRRGAQVVAMSAGAMTLCERVIVYDDFAETPRDFQLFDRGLGVVRDVQLFPHCTDRIQTDDRDNLAYLAHRFRHHVCVGLNQRSFLLLEGEPKRARSVGEGDAVYVFDPEGNKLAVRAGEEIPL